MAEVSKNNNGVVNAEEVTKILEKTRKLPPKLDAIVKVAAVAIGIYEILFIFHFTFSIYDLFSKIGIKISFLEGNFQNKQGEAFVLGMILVIAFLMYPLKKKEKYLKKVYSYDYLFVILSLVSMSYMFGRYPTYMVFYTVKGYDVLFGLIAIVMVLEATRRTIGWILPAIV
ncbi:MAG: C4-dicarboxylate ABC transporter permease, partial [Synergistetes bacterium]|nr:C4-dicarboxylate ABC transporter permease [Synergistota bacterium]